MVRYAPTKLLAPARQIGPPGIPTLFDVLTKRMMGTVSVVGGHPPRPGDNELAKRHPNSRP
jgi:hypothetical protein